MAVSSKHYHSAHSVYTKGDVFAILTYQLATHFKDSQVLFTVPGGAVSDMKGLEPYLARSPLRYDWHPTGAFEELNGANEGEFRRPIKRKLQTVIKIKSRFYDGLLDVNPWNVDAIVDLEDWRTSPRTLGSIVRAIEIADYFDIPKVYVAAKNDLLGVCHFAALRSTPYEGLIPFVEKQLPLTLQELKIRPRHTPDTPRFIDRIADFNPSDLDFYPFVPSREQQYLDWAIYRFTGRKPKGGINGHGRNGREKGTSSTA